MNAAVLNAAVLTAQTSGTQWVDGHSTGIPDQRVGSVGGVTEEHGFQREQFCIVELRDCPVVAPRMGGEPRVEREVTALDVVGQVRVPEPVVLALPVAYTSVAGSASAAVPARRSRRSQGSMEGMSVAGDGLRPGRWQLGADVRLLGR